MEWKEITEERYHEMLGAVPPAIWLAKGFLVGEAWRFKMCSKTATTRAGYAAFVHYKGRYWESDDALTVPEFQALVPNW